MFLLRVKCDDAAGWYNTENFADREILKNFGFEKKIEKISKNDLQKQKSVIYYVSVACQVRASWLKIE